MPDTWTEAEIEGLEQLMFGDGPELADELLDLVLSGFKTATCWSVRDGPQTKIGQRHVGCDGLGRPRAVLETIMFEQHPFSQVTEDFARKEGEGDLSLPWWRDAHEAYFARMAGLPQTCFSGARNSSLSQSLKVQEVNCRAGRCRCLKP